MKIMEQDQLLLHEFAIYKNIQKTTFKDYQIVVGHYTGFFNQSLTSLILEAEQEEQEGIRWKDSNLKKRLIRFRQYLYKNMNPSTADIYFIKIKALYKYKEIIIGELPRINTRNLNKSVPLTFKDLPTPEILCDAINKSSPLIRAYILFACSSGCAKNEILHLTVQDFIDATNDYHKQTDISEVLSVLKGLDDVVPTWHILRRKTNKYYTTFNSPEATTSILDYLYSRRDEYNHQSSLFRVHKTYLERLLRELNNKLGLGQVNGYGRLRTHTLRKYHASRLYNDGLSIDTVDALQGRGKDNTRSAYFIEDTRKLKEEYQKHMGCLLVTSKVKEMSVKSPEYIQLEVENEELREYLRRSMVQLKDLEEAVEVLYNQKG